MSKIAFDHRGDLVDDDFPDEVAPRRNRLRIVYGLALLGLAVPTPMSPWVALALGGGGFPLWMQLPMLGIVVLLFWRVVDVARNPHRLETPPVTGWLRSLRRASIVIMTLGAIVAVLRWFMVPLTRLIFGGASSGNGIEYFIVGLMLAMVSMVLPLGVILFEATRLVAFERWYREARDA